LKRYEQIMDDSEYGENWNLPLDLRFRQRIHLDYFVINTCISEHGFDFVTKGANFILIELDRWGLLLANISIGHTMRAASFGEPRTPLNCLRYASGRLQRLYDTHGAVRLLVWQIDMKARALGRFKTLMDHGLND
jgi:hypothetical protein